MNKFSISAILASLVLLVAACAEPITPIPGPDDNDPSKDTVSYYLKVDPAVVTLGCEAGVVDFKVETNLPSVEVSADSEWLGVISNSKGEVKVSYGENADCEERTAVVLFSSDTLQVAVNVTQQGSAPFLIVDPAELVLGSEAGEALFSLESNLDTCYVTTESEWLKVMSQGPDNVRVSYEENAGVKERTAVVLLSCDTLQVAVNVSQAGSEPYLRVKPAEVSVDSEAGETVFSVESNLDSFEVTSESGWVSILSRTAEEVRVAYEANPETEAREASVLFAGDTLQVGVSISQKGCPPPPCVDLSEFETANSYIVPAAGNYCFDISVVGNAEDGYIENAHFYPDDVYINPISVKVLWADNGVIDEISFKNGKVYFTAGEAKGNALVVAYGTRNNVLWSWHLWFTDQPDEVTHTNGSGEAFTLLDRNMGATSADPADGMATYGVYYQFGRKDPLRGVEGFRQYSVAPMYNMSDEDASYYLIQESLTTPDRHISAAGRTSDWASTRTHNVNMFLWGNPYYNSFLSQDNLVKTIYDPCPPGYLIAPGNTWDGIPTSRMERLNNGFWLSTNSGRNFYAAAGTVGGGDAAGKISDGWYYFAEDINDYTREDGKLYVCFWTSQAYYYAGDYSAPYGGKEFRVQIPFDYDTRTTYGDLIIQPNKGEGRRLRGFSVRCAKKMF